MGEGTVRVLGEFHIGDDGHGCVLCQRTINPGIAYDVEIWGRFTGDRKHCGFACEKCLSRFEGTFANVDGFARTARAG
jgi:recombinational DNA repair protein (RecF pathway)